MAKVRLREMGPYPDSPEWSSGEGIVSTRGANALSVKVVTKDRSRIWGKRIGGRSSEVLMEGPASSDRSSSR